MDRVCRRLSHSPPPDVVVVAVAVVFIIYRQQEKTSPRSTVTVTGCDEGVSAREVPRLPRDFRSYRRNS